MAMRYIVHLWWRWVSAVFLIGACFAAPLQQPITINNGNSIILSAILFAGIGAILGACVCCRRRKYGFEEFENEAGSIETARSSEFPIFQALSLSPNIRNGSTIPSDPSTINPQPPVRHPHINPLVIGEERIVPVINQDIIEMDNNNGPISPADLQNIENNNAGAYIQNQNEMQPPAQPVLEPQTYQSNSYFIGQQPLIQTQHNTISSPNTPRPSYSSQNNTFLPSISIIHDDNSSNSDDIHLSDIRIDLDEVPLLISPEKSSAKPVFETTQNQSIYNDLTEPNENTKTSAQETICYEGSFVYETVDITQSNGNIDQYASDHDSDEARGVEEALLALDVAISGADYKDRGDTDVDYTECENIIIKQLLPKKTVKLNEFIRRIPCGGDLLQGATIVELYENYENNEIIVDICHEAELLIDGIIEESIDRVYQIQHINDTVNRSLEAIDYVQINDNTHVLKLVNTEAFDEHDEQNTRIVCSSPNTQNESTDSFNDFDFKNLAIKASTPFIKIKNDTTYNSTEIAEPKQTKASQNLFGESMQTNLESSWCSPITDDATFNANNRNEQIENAAFVATEISNTDPKIAKTNPPKIRIICDQDSTSVDLTTATPVNTPIELNYSVDGWDTFVTSSLQTPVQRKFNEPSDTTYSNKTNVNVTVTISDSTFALKASSSNDWLINPDDEIDYKDDLTTNTEDDDDDQAEDGALLSLTFDSLRRQLTEALPHAQGVMSIGTQDFSDDEDEHDDVLANNNDIAPANLSNQPRAELFINYKRALSPIPEESEDDSTCKTFVFNDNKCLDSTSTGNMEAETAEAVMGVNKTLMASNDTLFNFDDTLGDRDDPFSPRTPSTEPTTHIAISQSGSNNSSIYESRANTGTSKFANYTTSNQEPVVISDSFSGATKPLVYSNNDATYFETSWEKPCELAAAEILSPDQPKTFSDDTCIELAGGGTSSDLSLTFDNTFTSTLDDKTCILVDRKNEISTTEIVLDDEGDDNASLILANTDATFKCCNSPQPIDLIDVPIIQQSSFEKSPHSCDLSGEEDPWIIPTEDICFTGASAEMMTTSFSTSPKEWDSDAEEDSSEEFMYVKGMQTRDDLPLESAEKDQGTQNETHNFTFEPSSLGETNITESEVWNVHADQVMVSKSPIRNEDDPIGENSSSSDADEEWRPSCWDSMAQPARSALKSPDKTSSEEDTSGDSGQKKRRRVVFKKQNYHSVYEYPKEMVALSPAYSEPQMYAWERSFGSRLPNHKQDRTVESEADKMDIFMVSSSTRPFHNVGHGGSSASGGSQFHAQCHTWPTSDAEFSWSQIPDSANTNEQYNFPSYSDIQIKWPDNLRQFFSSDDVTDGDMSNGDQNRPDSGVGESAEILTDSLGDLCHTKASLRLNLLSTTPQLIPKEQTNTLKNAIGQPRNDLDVTNDIYIEAPDTLSVIMPTPSCSGSMDSLSSSSGSERQISFTTFGKKSNQHSVRKESPNMFECHIKRTDTDSSSRIGSSMVFVDNIELNDGESITSSPPSIPSTTMSTNELELVQSPAKISMSSTTMESGRKPQNDSTDEDSGIESIMRIKTSSHSHPATMEKTNLKLSTYMF